MGSAPPRRRGSARVRQPSRASDRALRPNRRCPRRSARRCAATTRQRHARPRGDSSHERLACGSMDLRRIFATRPGSSVAARVLPSWSSHPRARHRRHDGGVQCRAGGAAGAAAVRRARPARPFLPAGTRQARHPKRFDRRALQLPCASIHRRSRTSPPSPTTPKPDSTSSAMGRASGFASFASRAGTSRRCDPILSADRDSSALDEAGTKRVVLSDALWRTRFAGDPSLVGGAIQLSGESYEVAGIAPPASTIRSPATWTRGCRTASPGHQRREQLALGRRPAAKWRDARTGPSRACRHSVG